MNKKRVKSMIKHMFLELLLLHMDDISLDCAFIFIFRIDCLQPADALLKLQEITNFKPRPHSYSQLRM